VHPAGTWTAPALEQAMAPFLAELEAVDTTPRARRPEHTFIQEVAPRRFEIRQKILGRDEPPEEALWMASFVIDLEAPRSDDDALLTLERIGV
jgi:hypothetical protein